MDEERSRTTRPVLRTLAVDDFQISFENFIKSLSLVLLVYLPCFFLDVVYSEFTIRLSIQVEQLESTIRWRKSRWAKFQENVLDLELDFYSAFVIKL